MTKRKRKQKRIACLMGHCNILIRIAEGQPNTWWWSFGDELRRPIDPFFPEMPDLLRECLWEEQRKSFAEDRRSLAAAVARFRDEVLIPCGKESIEAPRFLKMPQFESIQLCLERYMCRAIQEGALMETRQAFHFDAQLLAMVDGCLFDPSIRKPEECR